MSDDAIQDLLAELDGIAAGDKVSHWTISRARGQHEAHRARVAELTSALEGRATEVTQLKSTVEFLSSSRRCGPNDTGRPNCCVEHALERAEAEVAQLQARAETAEAERSAFVQVMSLQCDHATARAEKAEAECERLRKLVCTCEHCKDAVVTELRAALAGSLEERAALAHEVAEERASVAWLQEKIARLESAIADQVIADGVARGG